MTDATLSSFVKEALSAGASPAETEQALLAAGWSRDQIDDALNAYAAVPFVIPVPLPRPHLSARDAFLYLVMFSMLYLSTYNLGLLLFQFINLALPDPAYPGYEEAARASIRFATSTLIVAFPVFLYVATLLSRALRRDPAQRLSAVRRWLTYLTLAIAAGILVGDTIYLLNSLLSGELTLRVILKSLVVGGIAATVFSFYLTAMRGDDRALSS